jgi:hypothetical protein
LVQTGGTNGLADGAPLEASVGRSHGDYSVDVLTKAMERISRICFDPPIKTRSSGARGCGASGA